MDDPDAVAQRTLPLPDPDRQRGAFLGLAVGDAVGTTLEVRPPGTFEPIDDMVGGGPFGLAPGEWTDDTSMAACLAESLVDCGGFDADDQMRNSLAWYRTGHWSSTGVCFDIGRATASALERFERERDPYAGSTDPYSAGNGSLMRLAPVPIAFAHDPDRAVRLAVESSRTTHGARTCLDACRVFAALLVGAVRCVPKDALLDGAASPVAPRWGDGAAPRGRRHHRGDRRAARRRTLRRVGHSGGVDGAAGATRGVGALGGRARGTR